MEDCKGQIMARESTYCEPKCNKEEQRMCWEEFKRIEKLKMIQIDLDIPWYKRNSQIEDKGSCATDRGSCE